MLGTGCCAISDTIALTNHALASGVHNVLMLPPFYYKPVTDNALFEYYARVIESIGDPRLNIYLYHIPKNTGIDLSIDLLQQLLDRFPENIVGIKDSGGAWDHMAELMDKLPTLRLYSGTEEYLLDTLTAGGAGCISATANVTVSAAAELIRTFRNGTHAIAQQQQLTTLRNIFSGYPFVGAIKGFLASDSGDPSWNYMRPPNQMLENGVIALLIQKFRQNSLPTFQ
jgi:4-hydroxy-tetrahydrodipicolinate synthase